jgi:hypothetical protein
VGPREPHNIYSSRNITAVIMSRNMAYGIIGEMKNAQRILIVKTEGKRLLATHKGI